MSVPRPLYRVRPRNRLTRDALDVIWVMYHEGGVTIGEIAREVGRSPGTISIYLRELRAAKGGMDYLSEISGANGKPKARRRAKR